MKLLSTTFLIILTMSVSYAQQDKPTPEWAREIIDKEIKNLRVQPEDVHLVRNMTLFYEGDSLPIRIYMPTANEELPILYHIHGGAWVAGDLESHDNICRYLANHTGSIVIAIDYTRPPEKKFPVALNQCYYVFNWIREHAGELGGDKKKIAIIGDSAGGDLLGGLGLMLKDKNQLNEYIAQVFIDPATNLTDQGGSYKAYKIFIDWYLANREDSKNPYASPMLGKDFTGMPKTLMVTSEKDALRAEGKELYEKMKMSGVDIEYFEIAGIGHLGQYWAAGEKLALPAMNKVTEMLNQVFHNQ